MNDLRKLPKTRATALSRGLPRYYTGKPCKHGHVTYRTTYSGSCSECTRQIHEKFKADYRANKAARLAREAAAWQDGTEAL